MGWPKSYLLSGPDDIRAGAVVLAAAVRYVTYSLLNITVCHLLVSSLLAVVVTVSRLGDATRRHNRAMRSVCASTRVSSRRCTPRPDAPATLWHGSSIAAARLSGCNLPASCCAWRPHCGAETVDCWGA